MLVAFDTGIANLTYNNQEVLAVNGDKVESFVPKEKYQFQMVKFVVVEREKKITYSVTSRYFDY